MTSSPYVRSARNRVFTGSSTGEIDGGSAHWAHFLRFHQKKYGVDAVADAAPRMKQSGCALQKGYEGISANLPPVLAHFSPCRRLRYGYRSRQGGSNHSDACLLYYNKIADHFL